MQISVRSDFDKLAVTLGTVGRANILFAAARALTDVALIARADVTATLPSVFDRPTPFTMRSVFAKPATKTTLQSSVGIKDIQARYLWPEEIGGARRDKGSERSMKARGILGGNQQWVPGRGAALDAFGNVPRSAIVAMMSRVAAFGEQGYRANATAGTRKRLMRKGIAVTANGFEYFLKRAAGGKVVGIYKIVSAGTPAIPGVKGSSVRSTIAPMLVFTGGPATYRPRFAMFDHVATVAAAGFGPLLEARLAEAMAHSDRR